MHITKFWQLFVINICDIFFDLTIIYVRYKAAVHDKFVPFRRSQRSEVSNTSSIIKLNSLHIDGVKFGDAFQTIQSNAVAVWIYSQSHRYIIFSLGQFPLLKCFTPVV